MDTIKKFCIFMMFILPTVSLWSQPVKVMLVTGGHAFDTLQFFQMFNSLDGIEYKHFQQPEANAAIENEIADEYDVLVFYDMWKNISEPEKKAYIDLTQKGKPFLFLHHSLVSYQDWKQFEKMVGGKYVSESDNVPKEQHSNYEHDVWVYMEPVKSHPVTHGFGVIKLFDEIYGNTRISDDVIPLFKTNHPKSSRIIGWENKFNSSTIVYLQPGHDRRAFESEDYRNLIRQTIRYLAGTDKN